MPHTVHELLFLSGVQGRCYRPAMGDVWGSSDTTVTSELQGQDRDGTAYPTSAAHRRILVSGSLSVVVWPVKHVTKC